VTPKKGVLLFTVGFLILLSSEAQCGFSQVNQAFHTSPAAVSGTGHAPAD